MNRRRMRPTGPHPARVRHLGRVLFRTPARRFQLLSMGPANRKLVCAVDDLGIKAFFYAHRGGALRGQQQSGMRAPLIRRSGRARRTSGRRFHSHRVVPGPGCHDLRRCGPGSLRGTLGGARERGSKFQRYFTFPRARRKFRAKRTNCLDQFQALLHVRAVDDRLRTPQRSPSISAAGWTRRWWRAPPSAVWKLDSRIQLLGFHLRLDSANPRRRASLHHAGRQERRGIDVDFQGRWMPEHRSIG